jgi:hypothetical protein
MTAFWPLQFYEKQQYFIYIVAVCLMVEETGEAGENH